MISQNNTKGSPYPHPLNPRLGRIVISNILRSAHILFQVMKALLVYNLLYLVCGTFYYAFKSAIAIAEGDTVKLFGGLMIISGSVAMIVQGPLFLSIGTMRNAFFATLRYRSTIQ